MSSILVARLVWAVAVVAGYALTTWAVVRREPVNDSGLVPEVVLGFMLVTGGWLAAGLVSAVAGRHMRRTLGFLAAFVIVIGVPAMLVWLPPQWASELSYEARRDLGLIVAAFVGIIPGMTAVWLVVAALAWIADRTPLLRRVRWSDQLRRDDELPFWFPHSKR